MLKDPGKSHNMDVSVCIVSWNTRELLYRCLKSVQRNTVGLTYEIIVVDNDSQDGSADMVRHEFPDCKLIENENVGFAKGNNRAVKESSGKYVLYLNPDTELTSNALHGMYTFMEEHRAYGAVGCKLLNEDGSVQFTCARKFPTPFNQFCFLVMLDRLFHKSKWLSSTEVGYWDHLDCRDVDCLSGACIFVRREIVDGLGGFNEDYFMYGEDIELCYRIRKSGWLIFYMADIEIYHVSGASSSQASDQWHPAVMQREAGYHFMIDNCGQVKATEYRLAVLVGSLTRVIIMAMAWPIGRTFKMYDKNSVVHSLRKYVKLILWSINNNE